MIFVSTGCPASIGPEVALRAAQALRGEAWVLIGDVPTLEAAARLVRIKRPLQVLEPASARLDRIPNGVYLYPAGPELTESDRRPGKPSARAGVAQLRYVESAHALARQFNVPMVTAAVSKSAIAHSGARGARSFRGHTEWLMRLDGSNGVTMCFAGKKLTCALVTTHIPLSAVPRAITPDRVTRSTLHLVELLQRAGVSTPRVAVCSLNPHAGEDELLGEQERARIGPGVKVARRRLGDAAELTGPIGAETAFRQAASGSYDGVVAMYHDQATIPMKLLEFGSAVNVTMGLRIIRTSVDHGTAYDIAWQGKADDRGMRSAMTLALRLARGGGSS
jgi:4-phospho-D-threonate 3-dehydrogenase / 4-phospho-D-erythronate 3-dehydrogenase